MPAALAPIAGSVVGGLMSDGGGSSQTASKEPWEPARKPLINSINTGQDLERYYQQNPFNPLQQQGYQNLFSDLDQFRSQLSPQLMQFANSMMQSDYQRGPRNSQVEAMGRPMQQQMPQQYQTKPMQMQGGQGGGLMGAMGQAGISGMDQGQSIAGAFGGMPQQPGSAPSGLLAAQLSTMPQSGLLGAFQAPSAGNYGPLNFTELNPFTATVNGIPAKPVPTEPTMSDENRKLLDKILSERRFAEDSERFA